MIELRWVSSAKGPQFQYLTSLDCQHPKKKLIFTFQTYDKQNIDLINTTTEIDRNIYSKRINTYACAFESLEMEI